MRVGVPHGVASMRGMASGSPHSLWLWVLGRVREAIQVGSGMVACVWLVVMLRQKLVR